MKVKELIKLLQQWPENAEVMCWDSDNPGAAQYGFEAMPLAYIRYVKSDDSEQVFLEGTDWGP